jgi:hypothetical protein
MAPGDHFPNRIRTLIDGAHSSIALIGKGWMPKRGTDYRIGDDWITRELEYSRTAPLAHIEISVRERIAPNLRFPNLP